MKKKIAEKGFHAFSVFLKTNAWIHADPRRGSKSRLDDVVIFFIAFFVCDIFFAELNSSADLYKAKIFCFSNCYFRLSMHITSLTSHILACLRRSHCSKRLIQSRALTGS